VIAVFVVSFLWFSWSVHSFGCAACQRLFYTECSTKLGEVSQWFSCNESIISIVVSLKNQIS